MGASESSEATVACVTLRRGGCGVEPTRQSPPAWVPASTWSTLCTMFQSALQGDGARALPHPRRVAKFLDAARARWPALQLDVKVQPWLRRCALEVRLSDAVLLAHNSKLEDLFKSERPQEQEVCYERFGDLFFETVTGSRHKPLRSAADSPSSQLKVCRRRIVRA
jgi:hypothetical protein